MPGVGQSPPIGWPSGAVSGQSVVKTGPDYADVGWQLVSATSGFPGQYLSNMWYPVNAPISGNLGLTNNMGGNNLWKIVPFICRVPVTISALGTYSGSGTTPGTVSVAMWQSSGSLPGQLLGSASATSTPSSLFSVPMSLALAPAMYWVGFAAVNGFYITGFDPATEPAVSSALYYANAGSFTPTTTNFYGYSKAAGAANSNPTVSVDNSAYVPVFFIKTV